ncbi:translocase of chloroplast 159, chloroplastic [Tanacetum coccineum]
MIIRGNGLSIGGESSLRNVRSRSAFDVETNNERTYLPNNLARMRIDPEILKMSGSALFEKYKYGRPLKMFYILATIRDTSETAGDTEYDADMYKYVANADLPVEVEAKESDDLDFGLNIVAIGKAGVGKSATINSIFGEDKTSINAFQSATSSVKEISGVVGGVPIRVFDTPGLKSSIMEKGNDRSVLASAKKFTKKNPADIVLYVDFLDAHTRDHNDFPLSWTITTSLALLSGKVL